MNPGENGTSIQGKIEFNNSDNTGYVLTIDVFDPDKTLTQEQLFTLFKEAKETLTIILKKHYNHLPITGNVL